MTGTQRYFINDLLVEVKYQYLYVLIHLIEVQLKKIEGMNTFVDKMVSGGNKRLVNMRLRGL